MKSFSSGTISLEKDGKRRDCKWRLFCSDPEAAVSSPGHINMTHLQTACLFGAGLPILLGIVLLADRKKAFALDGFPTPLRKRAALGLFYVFLVCVVLLPVALSRKDGSLEGVSLRSLLLPQGFLVLFLFLWWLLSGRPSAVDFLRLRSRDPLQDLWTGLSLGVIGWGLTLVVGVVAGVTANLLELPTPHGVPPLVRWIAERSALEKVLVVLSAMTVEEFTFRAFLQGRLGGVSASIIFILAHAGYGEPFFFVGLLAITAILAIAFQRTGSTIAPIAAHGTFNAIQVFVVLPALLKVLDGP
jgi:membrane protease YdiL (CAAX protease family)